MQNLRQASPFFLGVGFATTLLITVFKALQIGVYLPPEKGLSFRKIYPIVAILMMTVSLVPFWGGQALFIYLLGHREKVGKTQALSIITLEQITEGFGKLFLFAVVAWTAPLPVWMKEGMRGAVIFVSSAALLLFFLAHRYQGWKADLTTHPPVGWKRLPALFGVWARELEALKDFKKVTAAFLLSVGMKALECLAIFWVQQSLGLSLPFYAPILVSASLALATLVPMAPGRLGVFEAAVFVIYQYLGVDPTRAAALALFVHFVHSFPLILAGYAASLKIGFKKSQVNEAPVILSPSES